MSHGMMTRARAGSRPPPRREQISHLSNEHKSTLPSSALTSSLHTDDTFRGDDLTRTAVRLDGLEVYALVGGLQTGASIAMMLEGFGASDDDFWPALNAAFLWCGVLAALGGTYSMIIFTLSSLYGKTALGMHRDSAYFTFMKETGRIRFRAFRAFTISLLLFCVQVVLLFAMLSRSRWRALTITLGLILVELGRRDCSYIIQRATPIFLPPNKLEPSSILRR